MPTDDEGRFCLRAVDGGTFASVDVPVDAVRSDAPVDPRFRDPEVLASIRSRGPTYANGIRVAVVVPEPEAGFRPAGAYEAEGLWNAATDSAGTCPEVAASPPWYRFDDLERSWQYVLLNVLPLATGALFVAGIALRIGARLRPEAKLGGAAVRAFQAAALAAVAAAALALVLLPI